MFINKIKDLPHILYHYCSIDSLHGIVTSKCFWLFDATKSNDSKEIRWADEIVRKNIGEAKKDGAKLAEINEAEEIYRSRRVPYIISFTKEGDLLSQWRGYGDNARGVSIGFDLAKLGLTRILPNNSMDRDGSTGICPVMYEQKAQEDFIKVFLDAIKEDAADGLDVGIWLSQVSYMFKNPHFKEEGEYRIIHTPWIGSTVDGVTWSEHSALSKMCHKVRAGEVISYYKLDFPKEDFIKEIILGPACPIKEEDLKLFLDAEGIKNVTVTKSKGSYRV